MTEQDVRQHLLYGNIRAYAQALGIPGSASRPTAALVDDICRASPALAEPLRDVLSAMRASDQFRKWVEDHNLAGRLSPDQLATQAELVNKEHTAQERFRQAWDQVRGTA